MDFKALYDNPVTATLLPCAYALATALVALRTKQAGSTSPSFVRVYGLVFALTTAADAYLNGGWSPLKEGSDLQTAASVTFVIVGDFRYFVVLEEASDHALKLVRAVVLAFVVPVSMQVIRASVPNVKNDLALTFLVYEVLFFAFALGLLLFTVKRSRDVTLARRATVFELVQYAVWIAADVGLLTTHEPAFWALRELANLLYYVACVPLMMHLLARRRMN